jgi:hypothetical protein
MCSGPSRSITRAALMTWVLAMIYRRRVSPGSGESRTGDLQMSALRSSSALYVSSIQQKVLDFFNNLYRESLRFPSQDMKRPRAALHPMSHWTSLTFLTWPILAMAKILLGFTSISRLEMIYPRSLLQETPKVHFFGFSLMLKRLRLAKGSSRSVMTLLFYWVFTTMLST